MEWSCAGASWRMRRTIQQLKIKNPPTPLDGGSRGISRYSPQSLGAMRCRGAVRCQGAWNHVMVCCARWLDTSTPKSQKGDFLACLTKWLVILDQKISLKSKKKIRFFFFFFGSILLQKCWENVLSTPKSHIIAPKSQKSKKKFFFIFHILCKKKSHLYIYFWILAPYPIYK